MAEFTWEARARTGELRKGVMEADNEEAVNQRLRQQQLNPVKVAKRRSFGGMSFGGSVSTKDLVTFTRLFATMIDAGLPLVQCLDILASQQSNPHFASVLKDIKGSVEGGATFSEALKRHPKVFDELFVNLTHAGEVGGILDSILHRLSVYMEKRQKLIRQVRGALVYPSIVIVIAGGVMTVLLTFVIPAFESMFKDFGGGKEAMPKITQIVIDFSHLFITALPFALVLAVLGFFGFGYVYRTPRGKLFFHKLVLKLPIMGNVLRKIAVARFTRTLGTLLQSGVPILDSLEICAKTSGNVVLENGIMSVRQAISEGKNMAEPLTQTQIFPDMVVQMIAVGEQTGALDQMLNKIADFYEEETDVAVAAMTSALEPILMVGVGGMVGIVLVSMYLPIFSLAGSIKAE
ncbi:MAG TPA: type II secretion system F family protein [Polyangiaceae bacterium]|nr:type II secretion system F family protein [Polyangiaceae bacterium]